MVINLSRCLTLSVSVVALSAIPVSAAYLNHDTRLYNASMIDTNTHTLKSESQSSTFIKTASVCFITDTQDCQGGEFGGSGGGYPDYNPNPEERCEKEGYSKVSCSSVEIPVNKCPYDETYIEKCECKPTLVECHTPNAGIGEACGGKFEACCNDECSAGYTTENGNCKQESPLKTACGNACYKVLDNTCKQGRPNAPAETGGYKNKIVYSTECGNPCWQSYDDNCASGYVRNKETDKCYETAVFYTDFGSACYKEKSCCEGINWCEIPQNCGVLGYNQQSCSSGKSVKCPYDLSYVFCL